MSVNNPYDAPKSHLDNGVRQSESIDRLASGQKLVIYSILLSFAAMIVSRAFPGAGGATLALALLLVTLVLSIMGVLRLCEGMGYSTVGKVLLVIALFVPLISLIVLVVLSMQATSRLKEAGYTVGFLGAKR